MSRGESSVGWEVREGDCIDVMAAMPEASIDAIVCDPPYGLEFMGRNWDRLGDGFRRRENPADVERDDPFGRASRTSPEYRAGRAAQGWHEAWAREAVRVLKPGGHLLAFGGTRTYHRLACAIEDAGFEVRDCLTWLYGSGFPKSLDVSKAIDKAAGAEPVDLGESPNWRESKRDREKNGSMEVRGENAGRLTAPATPDAERWQGWGTALKPAHEPIVVARKPLAGTVTGNVLAHGTGALNIDGCRIGPGHANGRGRDGEASGQRRGTGGVTDIAVTPGPRGGDEAGRWPANVVLDEHAAALLDAQTPDLQRQGNLTHGPPDSTGATSQVPNASRLPVCGYADEGASRFFYVAKAASSERHNGGQNEHPTVKPVALMCWLVRLVTPPGGTVLDPFTGSGTTGIAAMREGVSFIGVEREPDYVQLARRRIVDDAPLLNGIAEVAA